MNANEKSAEMELVETWRASADKAERHLGAHGMDIENETHMRDMRLCADKLEAVTAAEALTPERPKCDYTGAPSLASDQLCRCGTCQLYAKILFKWLNSWHSSVPTQKETNEAPTKK